LAGAGITGLQFILFYSIFLFFFMQISSMAGQDIIKGVSPPNPPTGIADALFTNFSYFFKLMSISSSFAILGAIILTPFIIGLIFVILQLARGTG
jgi:NADH:ubiquinone oxidoreductase subunit 6 (subunit J)